MRNITRNFTTVFLVCGVAGCGGLELGGVASDEASEIEILSEEEAAAAAEAEIHEGNLDDQVDDLLKEIEADEADG